ncbi:hypothetical protein ACFYNO_20100 [Kitasatospora sp. NPDC006697]|uniref:hypothetical protein n=1 Tax=Kitasatospora sp. NPDC006697 TaxID=3364020 RepID=UPI003688A7FE
MKLLSPRTGEPVEYHPALRVGREYLVLEVMVRLQGDGPRTVLRVLDEEREPHEPFGGHSLWNAELFETVSDRMPGCWVPRRDGDLLVMGPEAWHRDGFWEDYYSTEPGDGPSAAWRDYREALALIRADA